MKKRFYLDAHEKAFAVLVASFNAQMKGKKISRIFRTVGCAFIIDLGKLTKYGVVRRTGRILRHGEWGVLVDMARWTIFRNGRKFLAYSNPQQRIDQNIKSLKGRALRRLFVSKRGSMRLEFEGGFRIAVSAEEDGWALFCARDWSLSYDIRRKLFAFEVYQKSE